MLVLAAITVTWTVKHRSKSRGVRCVQNQKLVGLAHKTWAKDSEDVFPVNCSTNRSGTKELIGMGLTYRHFLALSNEVAGDLKVLICPADGEWSVASYCNQLANTNLSYFVGVDASETLPNTLRLGDRTSQPSSQPICTGHWQRLPG